MNKQTMDFMYALMHWFQYADSKFPSIVWKDNPMLANHFADKLTGKCRLYGDYLSWGALLSFMYELDTVNLEKLTEYIMQNHKNKWR